MREMLYDAAGDLDTRTGGALRFYVDTLGVSGSVEKVRHNCYLRVPKTGYTHLLFRVTTPVPGPWPTILQRDRTKEIVLYLLSTAR
jgi:hypothetical protein